MSNMNYKDECVFCNISNGTDKNSLIVWENEHVVCFIPLKMEVYGHLLVAPKNHSNSILDMNSKDFQHLASGIKKTTDIVTEKLGADGVNILNANGLAAGQSVPHTHFHIMPRFKNDGLELWPSISGQDHNKNEVFIKLRSETTKKRNSRA